MYGTETDADRLLDDTLRMIRVDAYRMSMVAVSYASCTMALHLLIRQQSLLRHNSCLKDRLVHMYEKLDEAKTAIGIALKSRSRFPRTQVNARDDAALDSVAEQVIKRSVTLLDNACRYRTIPVDPI